MSIEISSVSAGIGEEVNVPVKLTADYWGVSGRLHYYSSALNYTGFTAVQSLAASLVNPGELAFALFLSGNDPPIPKDPEIFLTVQFQVLGPSLLTLSDIGASDSAGQDVAITAVDGAVTIEDTNVNFEAYWDAPPSSLGVVGTKVFVGNSADVNDGSFQQVADIAQPGNVAPFNLDANQGQRYAYAYHYDGEGDQGPNSSVVAFSTDAALPAPAGFGVRVV